MKKIAALLLIAGLAFGARAQNTAAEKPAAEPLQLKEKSFDFGKIQQGRPVTHVFEIVNTGKEPIHLENVQASCGCTTPEWSKEPIKPGGTTQIKVGYNAAGEGVFSKTVTIQYEGNKTSTLVISGNVFKSPTTSAPANPSLALLKN
jgi:hypothetical protein